MTQPFDYAGDGPPAGPAPDATAAGSCAADRTGPGVPLTIWPGLPDPGGAGYGLPCGGPVTTAAARRVIDTFSVPGDLAAAARAAGLVYAQHIVLVRAAIDGDHLAPADAPASAGPKTPVGWREDIHRGRHKTAGEFSGPRRFDTGYPRAAARA